MQALMNAKTGGEKIDDSLGDKSNNSKKITESYDTDTFEDASQSHGSAAKK